MSDGALRFETLLTTKDFEAGIRRIENEIISVSKTAERETAQMDNAFKNLSIGLGAYFSVSTLKGFTQQLIQVRGEFQKTEIAFGTMLQSKEKANQLMGEMVDLAAKTPFALQDVTEGAKRLLAFQVPAEQVTETLTRLGNVASGLGVPVGQLIHVFGQVKAQGKMMTNDLYQFMNAGIPILSELGKALGKTEAEIKDMVGQGKIGFEEITQVINNMTNEGGMFYNLMEEQSKSLTGQVANLEDAIEQMFNQIGESSEGILSSGIEGVTYLVENYEKLGAVLLGIITTYGIYKGALIATSAWNAVVVKNLVYEVGTRNIAIGATWAQVKAQLALNTAQLANPTMLLIAGIAGLTTMLFGLTSATENAKTAEQEWNEQQEKKKELLDEHKNKINALINVIRNETESIYARTKAYKELKEELPELFENMSMEEIKLANLEELRKKVNQSVDKKDFEAQKKEIEILDEKIKKTEEWYQREVRLYQEKGIVTFNEQQRALRQLDELTIAREKQIKLVQELEESLIEAKGVDEQIKHWEALIEEEQKAIEKATGYKFNLLNAKGSADPLINEINTLSRAWVLPIERLEYFMSMLNKAKEKKNSLDENKIADKDKKYSDWDTESKNAKDRMKELLPNTKEYEEAKKAYIKAEEQKKRWDVSLSKSSAGTPKKITGSKKQLAEVFSKDSIKDLEERISLWNNALQRAGTDDKVKVRAKNQYGEEKETGQIVSREEAVKQIEELHKLKREIEKKNRLQTFDEEMQELERQWRVRYKLAEQYGEEVAKAQFPNLQGDSYFDEINKKFQALDLKSNSGITLSDEELDQWEKLKQILDNLNGVKDPFTNFKDGLEKSLNEKESGAEKIAFLKEKLKNLSDAEIMAGAKAEIIQRLEAEKQALKDAYQSFLENHRTYEEQRTKITKQFAELRNQAESESDRKKVDDAEKNALSKLDMDQFKLSDDWSMAFANVEYMGTAVINRLIAKMKEFRDSNADLQPTEIKEINDAIERLQATADRKNPFQALGSGLKELIQSKRRLKDAQEEYNQAVENGDLETQVQAQTKINNEEKKGADALQRFTEGAKTSQAIFNATAQVVMDITDAFGGMDDATKDAMEDVMNITNAAMDFGSSLATGDIAGMIKSGIALIGSVFQASSGDKKRERAIKAHEEAVKTLAKAYQELEKAINKALGQEFFDNSKKAIDNLKEQQKHLQQMIEKEGEKKKKDKGKIDQWKKEIANIQEQIENINSNVINEILNGVDAKGLADRISDALVTAFKNGEDAAQALNQTFDEIMFDMVSNALKMQILEPLMKNVVDKMLNSMGYNHFTNEDEIKRLQDEIKEVERQRDQERSIYGISMYNTYIENLRKKLAEAKANQYVEGEFDGLTQQERDEIRDMLLGGSQQYYDALKGLEDIFGDTFKTSKTLKGAIQGMTEESAGLIAGQFNAIRINIAEIGTKLSFSIEIAQNSLSELVKIEYNTSKLHAIKHTLDAINNKLDSGNMALRASGN